MSQGTPAPPTQPSESTSIAPRIYKTGTKFNNVAIRPLPGESYDKIASKEKVTRRSIWNVKSELRSLFDEQKPPQGVVQEDVQEVQEVVQGVDLGSIVGAP